MGNAKLTPRNILVSLALKYKGEWDKITEAIKARENPDEELIEEASQTKAITLLDPEYPMALKQGYKPPIVLFYKGDISLLGEETKAIAYIGSRNASEYGKKTASEIVKGLKNSRIVSGFSRGICETALKTALDGGKAIAVLGCGIDRCYPKELEPLYDELAGKGLILSEYPSDAQPTSETFPMRNRIVASLANAVVVGEADKHSGTLLTVSFALNMGKDIGCVPFRADEASACNDLIKDGANLIQDAQDALDMVK